MVIGVLVEEEARLEPKLVYEVVGEAVVVRQPHRAQLRLPAILQISERKSYPLTLNVHHIKPGNLSVEINFKVTFQPQGLPS